MRTMHRVTCERLGVSFVLIFGAAAHGAPAIWRAIPGAAPNARIETLLAGELDGTPALIVGGMFGSFGQPDTAHIAAYRNGQWGSVHSAGQPLDGSVSDMVFTNAGGSGGRTLAVCGFFNLVNTSGTTRTVARLVNGAWTPLSGTPGPNTWNGWLASYDDGTGERLHTSGGWDVGGGLSYIARWGGSWAPLSNGLFTTVQESVEFAGAGTPRSLWLAGGLAPIDLPSIQLGVARWDGAWHSVGGGMNGVGYAIAVFDDGRGEAVYVGGSFTRAGLPGNFTNVRNIARWDGVAWEPLGAGVLGGNPNEVLALCVFDGGAGHGPSLYAAGTFNTAGSTAVSNIARWDGSQWHAVGSGINGTVEDLCVFDPDGSGPASPALVAAGSFTLAGQVTVQNLAVLVSPPPECAGDVNGDGHVNTADLVGLLGAFGGSYLTGTPSDLNADGAVNTIDLTAFLGVFGVDCQ